MLPSEVIAGIRALIENPPIVKKVYYTVRNKKAIRTGTDKQIVGKKMKIVDPESWKLEEKDNASDENI